MRQRPTYLNIILSAIAVLLTAQLWVSVSERPLLANEAEASTTGPPTIPNAAAQRKVMTDEIKKLQKEVAKTNTILKDQKIRVEVSNLDELARSSGASGGAGSR